MGSVEGVAEGDGEEYSDNEIVTEIETDWVRPVREGVTV